MAGNESNQISTNENYLLVVHSLNHFVYFLVALQGDETHAIISVCEYEWQQDKNILYITKSHTSV